MNIVEALKLSNTVRVEGPFGNFYVDISAGDDCNIPSQYLSLTNWEPIIEKKTVKKKFYQILISNKTKKYFLLERVFETQEQAKEYCVYHLCELIRFLVENPIEVEVEETNDVNF